MMLLRETDALLRRFERNQVVVCVVMAAAAVVAGRLNIAAGIAGGALLMAVGYGGIKALVTLMTAAATGSKGPGEARTAARRRAWTIVKFVSLYALLVLGAYVMLVRLRLHPVGVLLGASTPVVSAAIEGVAMARRPSRSGQR
jgi:hypothetical protein